MEDDIQKRMRMMKDTQQAYAGDAKQTIKKQIETLQALMRENEKLKGDIQNAAKHSSVKHNIDHQNNVGHYKDQLEVFDRKVGMEQERLDETESEIELTRRKILEARRVMGGVNVTKDNSTQVERQIKVLENRLDQALVKFNEALAFNKHLREQIDNLRRERVVFDGIYKKLERELHEKKKQMADIIEKSNLYYEERDLATNELANLKTAAEKDMLAYEERFRQLEIMNEADKQLKESLKQSQRHRPGLGNSIKSSQMDSPKSAVGASPSEDANLSPKSRKAREEHREEREETAKENYDEVVDQLYHATGITDLHSILEKFQKAEEQNFSMYNFVNDLNNEVERLHEEIEDLKKDFERQGGTAADAQRNNTLRQLEDKLARVEASAEDYETKLVTTQDSLGELRGCVEGIFTKLGCTAEDVGGLGHAQVTDTNLMFFLGVIEQRGNEMLQLRTAQTLQKRHAAINDEDEDEPEPGRRRVDIGMAGRPAKVPFFGTGPMVAMGQTNLNVGQLPSTGDTFGTEGFDDAEDDRVLTQAELRAQTEQRLAAKDEAKRDPKRAKQKKKKDYA